MRRFSLLACLALAVQGCGVSKDLYQAEVIRGQELEARGADLDARLETERDRSRSLEEDLEQKAVDLDALRQSARETEARLEDLTGRLQGCLDREAALQADLDLRGKSRDSLQESLSACRKDMEVTRAGWDAERKTLLGQVEAARSENAVLAARLAVLQEEKERAELERRERVAEISKTYEGLVEGLKEEVAQGRVTISNLKGRLTVNLLDEILFDSGSITIKEEGKEVLARVGQLLGETTDKAIVIEGHTDNVPITGELTRRFPTNWELSTGRATSVVRYLQEAAAVLPERLAAVGYGPYRPVAPNDTPEGRARNRRIEIKLVPLDGETGAPVEPGEGAPTSE